MIVDDYTRQGYFKHLRECGGRAYVAQEEMTAFFDLVQQREQGRDSSDFMMLEAGLRVQASKLFWYVEGEWNVLIGCFTFV